MVLPTQSVHGLVGGILWGGFARIFAADNATWAVNSLGHTIGNREFRLRDESRNIGALAAPTMGGSWHNNHHARPALAQTRRHWWQLDLAGEFIRLLACIGLVQQHSAPEFVVGSCRSEIMSIETNGPTTVSTSEQESLARAILQLNPRSARAKRVVALVTIGVPAIGFAIAVYLMCTGRATALDYTLFAVFYAIQTFGIGIGFHRYVAHKSFKTSRFFEGVLMVTGSMALEGPLLFWVSTHRRHHRFSDEAGDPHSPNLSGAGLGDKLRGLWYAHIPWMFSDKESRVSVFAPDVLRDRHLYNYSRTYPIWALASLLLPGVLGFAIGGTMACCIVGFGIRRTGAGVRRQSSSVVRWVHQPHGRIAAVRHPRQQRQQLAGGVLHFRRRPAEQPSCVSWRLPARNTLVGTRSQWLGARRPRQDRDCVGSEDAESPHDQQPVASKPHLFNGETTRTSR